MLGFNSSDDPEMAKDFMKECMAEGKTVGECANEWKKKYPDAETPKEEIAEVEELAKSLKEGDETKTEDKDLIALEKRIKQLEDEKSNLEAEAKVDASAANQRAEDVGRFLGGFLFCPYRLSCAVACPSAATVPSPPSAALP